jgi:hypothetical protein
MGEELGHGSKGKRENIQISKYPFKERAKGAGIHNFTLSSSLFN